MTRRSRSCFQNSKYQQEDVTDASSVVRTILKFHFWSKLYQKKGKNSKNQTKKSNEKKGEKIKKRGKRGKKEKKSSKIPQIENMSKSNF